MSKSKTRELFDSLFVPFPEELQETKRQGGQDITFVGWTSYVLRAHRQFPEGYSKDVRVTSADGYDKQGEPVATLIVTVRITDNATGAYQEALGAADAGKTSWGGAVAEAESQALRRAFANWGLGLDMYLDDDQFDIWTQGRGDDDGEDDEGEEEDGEEEDDGEEEGHAVHPEPGEEEGEAKATPRMIEVLTVVGKVLAEHANENEDGDLEAFIEAMRLKLSKGLTHKRAGVVISKFRAKLEELDLEDPTRADAD